MSTVISPRDFYTSWKSVCTLRQHDLLTAWDDSYAYTRLMLGNRDGTIVRNVAESLAAGGAAWNCYCEYYSLDAVFYLESDLAPEVPDGSTWLANMRIAFEHENDFTSGLFQEVSHLMTTRTELRVLVTYPEEHDLVREFTRLSSVISNSGLVNPNFLLITGKGKRGPDRRWAEVEWLGYTYESGKITRLNS